MGTSNTGNPFPLLSSFTFNSMSLGNTSGTNT